MKCLACGKELNNRSIGNYHIKCLKKVFNSSSVPVLDFSYDEILAKSETYIKKEYGITGVQEKLSLYLEKRIKDFRFTSSEFKNGFIVKFNSKEYPWIVEGEHLVMLMAEEANIEVAPHALILSKDNKYAYITKRIDRKEGKKIHMEDFCQLSSRLTEDKYNSSYERCAKVIDEYSSTIDLDKINLFQRLVFCYLTCNSDMHLKNFSLIEDSNGNHLSPAYDLLPVSIILKKDKEEMALSLNGKKMHLTINDFLKFAITSKIDIKAAKNAIKDLVEKESAFISLINESLIPNEEKKEFIKELSKRTKKLSSISNKV